MQQNFPLRIAIIGAGASGTLLTVQLCRLHTNRELQIFLIDKPTHVGKGLAYSTTDPLHLLNVPAGRISALPNEPDHFINWLQNSGFSYNTHDFVPRSLYGHYLTELLKQTIQNCPPNTKVSQISGEAISISTGNETNNIYLADGQTLQADKIVLALGNFPPGAPCSAFAALPPTPLYAADPWNEINYQSLAPDDPVVLIGSGLTMVDVVMTLASRGHRGQIMAVSTHGHLPNVHGQSATYQQLPDNIGDLKTVHDWVYLIRAHIKQAQAQGLCWRSVIDAFRPYSQPFWLNLSVNEKRRFMRHLRHIWAISRHRMPPLTSDIIERLITTGQLQIRKGKVAEAKIAGDVLELVVKDRKGNTFTHNARKVINCTGPESDFRKVDSRLVKDLLQKGFIAPDALFLGLAATPDGSLMNSDGEISNWLFSIGPPLKGVLWESTAIPEIRNQAKSLSEILVV